MFAVLEMSPDMSLGQWLLVTLTAGVGGSMLSIGSAAGVAVMGTARGMYTFFGHLKWSLGDRAGVYRQCRHAFCGQWFSIHLLALRLHIVRASLAREPGMIKSFASTGSLLQVAGRAASCNNVVAENNEWPRTGNQALDSKAKSVSSVLAPSR